MVSSDRIWQGVWHSQAENANACSADMGPIRLNATGNILRVSYLADDSILELTGHAWRNFILLILYPIPYIRCAVAGGKGVDTHGTPWICGRAMRLLS
jgi:hypothetical protein